MSESGSEGATRQVVPTPRESSVGGKSRPPGVRQPDPTLGRLRPVERPKATIERVPDTSAHLKGGGNDIDPPTKPKRQRVVLADPTSPAHATALRGRVELAEQTSWGEMLIRDLVRAQLRSALLMAGLLVSLVGGLALAFALVPGLATLTVGGIPVAWLLVATVPFPLLITIGYWHHRLAERHERAFVDMIEN